MKIPLEKIGPEGFHVDRVLSPGWTNEALGEGTPFSAASDGRLRLHLIRSGEVVYAQGEAVLEVQATCSRCLETAALPIIADIQVSLYPRGKEPPPSADGEISEEDAGVATYEDMEIDLSSIVRDEIFLGLPMSALCSESCAGLCPQCGANLNAGACGCEAPGDARWAALRRLKKDDTSS